jgi:hypothetical protein
MTRKITTISVFLVGLPGRRGIPIPPHKFAFDSATNELPMAGAAGN